MQLTDEIDRYINRLKNDYGLSVTLHPTGREYLISNSSLIKYNFHNSAYCTYVKSNREAMRTCVKKQSAIEKKLLTEEVFTGVCHAGVKERVYGFYLRDKYLGFISVSGYKADKEIYVPRIKKICNDYLFTYDDTLEIYERLSDKFPDTEMLDSLIFPLRRMIEYGNMIFENIISEKNSLYVEIIRYLNEHFCDDISLKTLSVIFAASVSQISHTFKKYNGRSVRDYINMLRTELAKELLRHTDKNITDIAMITGYSDSCYFCNVFKKVTGLTPGDYRKSIPANHSAIRK